VAVSFVVVSPSSADGPRSRRLEKFAEISMKGSDRRRRITWHAVPRIIRECGQSGVEFWRRRGNSVGASYEICQSRHCEGRKEREGEKRGQGNEPSRRKESRESEREGERIAWTREERKMYTVGRDGRTTTGSELMKKQESPRVTLGLFVASFRVASRRGRSERLSDERRSAAYRYRSLPRSAAR